MYLCSKQLCNIKRLIRDYSYKFLNNQGHWLNIVKLKTNMCFSLFELWLMNVHVTIFILAMTILNECEKVCGIQPTSTFISVIN
jgi:hypothetical protein